MDHLLVLLERVHLQLHLILVSGCAGRLKVRGVEVLARVCVLLQAVLEDGVALVKLLLKAHLYFHQAVLELIKPGEKH